MTATAKVSTGSNTQDGDKVRAKRVARDPAAARKLIEARIEKLKAQLEAKNTELAKAADPKLAAIEARLKAATAELNATNRTLKLRDKGLATMLRELADQRAAIAKLNTTRADLQLRVEAIQAEFEKARAGVS